MHPTISIAMATYNGAAHLREQLDSLASQSLLPAELVVTDDQSTDRTLEVLGSFARTAPFAVRIHRNERKLGFGDNFLRAASLCRGEVIAFCDQDDRWFDHKLRVCAGAFADPEVLVCVHSARLWYGRDEFGGLVPHFKCRETLAPAAADPLRNFLGFSNLFRRRVLELTDNQDRPRHPNIVASVGAEPHTMVHDQWVWFIGSIFGKVVLIPEVQCLYRQHVGNTVGFTYKARPVRERLLLDKASIFAQGEEVAFECAAFIERIAADFPQDLRLRAAAAASAMRSRASIFRLRKRIYAPEAPLSSRWGAFVGVLHAQGYRERTPNFSFGQRAFLKDLLIGVPGALKLLRR